MCLFKWSRLAKPFLHTLHLYLLSTPFRLVPGDVLLLQAGFPFFNPGAPILAGGKPHRFVSYDDAGACSLEDDGEEIETGHDVGEESESKDCGGDAMSKEKLGEEPLEDIEISESTDLVNAMGATVFVLGGIEEGLGTLAPPLGPVSGVHDETRAAVARSDACRRESRPDGV
ncbi:hypothetical protein PG984_013964 [Apiospora sp. TS-2023a]